MRSVGVPLIPFIRGATATGLDRAALDRPIVDTAIPYDAVWDCVTCGACVEACPVVIEHVDKIVGLRRNLVLEEARFPAELNSAFTAMERHGDPWGLPASQRLDWTKGLPFEVPIAAQVAAAGPSAVADLECLYWVGCAASFDERNRRVARAFVTCLEAAGVRYAVLGQEESCTGDPGSPDGQRLRLPAARHGEHRHPRPVPADDHRHRLSSLLQCPGRRVRAARRALRGGPPLDLPGTPGGGGEAVHRLPRSRMRRSGSSPTTTPATWRATTMSWRSPAPCWARCPVSG